MIAGLVLMALAVLLWLERKWVADGKRLDAHIAAMEAEIKRLEKHVPK